MSHAREFVAMALFLSRTALAAPAEVDERVTIPLVLGLGAGWLFSEALKPQLARDHCSWCEPGAADAYISSKYGYIEDDEDTRAKAARVSRLTDALAFGATPALMLGSTFLPDASVRARKNADTWVVMESTLIAVALNQATKLVVARERPFVHGRRAERKEQTAIPSDNNTSFYSGHATFTFALASSATTVAAMRGSSWTPWIGGTGALLAGATAWGRVVAGKHYATDVVVGGLMGIAVGVTVPLLLHGGGAEQGSGPMNASAPLLGYSGAW